MQNSASDQELKDRLNLIEEMIAAGRRTTERWGWVFVLWGIAFYVALAWTAWRSVSWAWPVTVSIAAVISAVVPSLKSDHHPKTTIGRAVGCIWVASAISMFLLFIALGVSARLTDVHIFMAVLSAMLGTANGASAMILRWKAQLGCAVVWWIAAIATCFGNDRESMIVFLAAIFFCQIIFGIYGMIAESQQRKPQPPLHA